MDELVLIAFAFEKVVVNRRGSAFKTVAQFISNDFLYKMWFCNLIKVYLVGD